PACNRLARDFSFPEIFLHCCKRFSIVSQRALGEPIRKQTGSQWQATRTGQDYPPGLSPRAHTAHSQSRIICSDCLCSYDNCVHARTKPIRVPPSSSVSDPARLRWLARQAAIEGHPAFCDDEGPSAHNPFIESLVKPRALLSQNAFTKFDSCSS